MGFPINAPVRAAKGTVTDGSKEERLAYNSRLVREKRGREAENKAKYMEAATTIQFHL